MLRILGSNQPLAHLLIPILIVAGAVAQWYVPLTPWTGGFLSEAWISGVPKWVYLLLESAGMWLIALRLNRLFNNGQFTGYINHFPEFLVVLLLLASTVGKSSLYPVIAILCFVLGLDSVTRVYRQNVAMKEYFEAALWFSLGALFWKSLTVMFPVLLVAIAFTRAFNWREHMASIGGFLIPFFWAWSINYLVGGTQYLDLAFHFPILDVSGMLDSLSSWHEIAFVLVGVLTFFLALRSYLFSYNSSTNQSRHVKSIVLMFLAGSFFLGSLASNNYLLCGMAVPLCLILPFAFLRKNPGFWTQLLFYAFLGSVLIKITLSYVALL